MKRIVEFILLMLMLGLAGCASSPSSSSQQIAATPEINSAEQLNALSPDLIIGVSSVTVEKLAIKRNCQPVSGATLFFKNGPIEDYRVKCVDGSELGAHCQYRQCTIN